MTIRCSAALLALALVPCATAQDLLVTSWNNSSVLRYDLATGASTGTFVSSGSGGLAQPHSAVVGPDGTVYVTSFGNNSVKYYDGPSAAPLGTFVTAGSGGLNGQTDAFFGPDGNL